MTNTRVIKQVKCPVLCWFFKCFISNITEKLNPAELGFEDDTLQTPQNIWQNVEFATSHIHPHSLPCSERKGKEKAIYFMLLRNQWCNKISLSPYSLVFLWEFCSPAHIIHPSLQRLPVPFSWDSSSRCMPEAEDMTWGIIRCQDITWGIVRCLCRDPSPAKMHLSTSFKREEAREIILPSEQPLNGEVSIRAGRQKQTANDAATSAAGKFNERPASLTPHLLKKA